MIDRRVLRIAAWSAFLALIGRAYHHLRFEGPYRAFFLDENWNGWYVSCCTSQTWLDFVNNPATDAGILLYTRILGTVLAITAIAFLVSKWVPKSIAWTLALLSTLGIGFMGFSYYLDMGYQSAQFIEYTAQTLMPLLMAWIVWGSPNITWRWLMKLAIALTFLGHGLYALNVFPVPGNFVYMIQSIMGLSDAAAKDLLWIAGILDLAVVVGLFIPAITRYALIYAFIWGLLTSLARPFAYILFNHLFYLTVHQYLFEFFVRVPHFMLPLILLLIDIRSKIKDSIPASQMETAIKRE
jgi:hypothetical protein